jgi:sugar lactone lactonase YvrE
MCEPSVSRDGGEEDIVKRLIGVLAVATLVVPVGVAGAAVDVEVVVDYNAALGEHTEGVAVDKRGDVFVSVTPLGQIRKYDPDGAEIQRVQVIPAGVGLGLAGLAVDAPGNLYVAAITLSPATQGVYKIARDGSFTRLAGTAAIGFPNGLTLDKRGNVYVTDTARGAVWRVPADGDPAVVWYESALLQGTGAFGFGFPLGANGIAYRQGEIVVGNTERARLVRIAIEPNGSAGAVSVLAEAPALLGVDGLAFDVHGNVWAAVIAQSTIVRVSPTGAISTVATAADGLDWASSIAFGKRGELWAVNYAIGPPGGPGPALLRLSLGVQGQPVP